MKTCKTCAHFKDFKCLLKSIMLYDTIKKQNVIRYIKVDTWLTCEDHSENKLTDFGFFGTGRI